MKPTLPLLRVFAWILALVAIITIIPLTIILFHATDVFMFRGDQQLLTKVRPYILYGIHGYNLPHFCREFWVSPLVDGGPNNTIIEAITTNKRPLYSTSYSTYTISIDVHWTGGQKPRYYAYYLPSSSFVSITTCGKTTAGINLAFNIPVFNDYDKMDDWAHPNERDPDSPDITFLAQFDACPSMRTVQFNTTGYPAGKWYLLFGAGYQNSTRGLDIDVELEFTKHLLQVNSTAAVGTCTATAESRCAVTAPPDGEVYVVLSFKVDSESNGQIQTKVSCSKYEVTPYVMYFMVLPLALSFLLAALLWRFCDNGNEVDTGPITNEIVLTSMQPLGDHDDTPTNILDDLHRTIIASTCFVIDLPPDYDHVTEYPIHDSGHALTMPSNPIFAEAVIDDRTDSRNTSNRSSPGIHPSTEDHPPGYESVVVIPPSQGDQGGDVYPRTSPITRRWSADDAAEVDEQGCPLPVPPNYDIALDMPSVDLSTLWL